MKVLYFHQHYTSPKGASGIRSYAMSQALVAKGHEVTIVCGSYQSGNTGLTGPFQNGLRRGVVFNGVEVIELDLPYSNSNSLLSRTWLFLKFATKSSYFALAEKYDVVFATSTPLTAGIPGIFAHWIRRKPFVFEVRDLWPELPRAMGVITNPILLWLMRILEWVSYHSADHVIGLSPGIIDGISKRGVKSANTTLIPNGCDLDMFSTASAGWRPSAIKDSDLLVLYAGTHGVANGLESVLNAAQELLQRGRRDIKFLLIGEGKLKAELKLRAEKENLENVIFHDAVDKERLASLMNAVDIGLQVLANVPAFYYGTSPNKFFDYISAGVPVLNNYPGWLAELIEEQKCGVTVPPNNPIEFANAMESVEADRPNLKVMGEYGRKMAERDFDREILAAKWIEVLERVFDNSRARSTGAL